MDERCHLLVLYAVRMQRRDVVIRRHDVVVCSVHQWYTLAWRCWKECVWIVCVRSRLGTHAVEMIYFDHSGDADVAYVMAHVSAVATGAKQWLHCS